MKIELAELAKYLNDRKESDLSFTYHERRGEIQVSCNYDNFFTISKSLIFRELPKNLTYKEAFVVGKIAAGVATYIDLVERNNKIKEKMI